MFVASARRLLGRRFRSRFSPSGSHRPLRCLFVITSMPVGGAETLLVNLIRRIDPNQVVCEIACLKERGPLGEAIADEFRVHQHLIRSRTDVGVLWRLNRLIVDRRIDAVITVGAGDKMFWGRLAAFLSGVPVIAAALHSTGWPDGVGRLNRLLTPITDRFIAVAQSHGTFLRQFERFPGDRVAVIRNGIDCDRFRPDAQSRRGVLQELNLPADAVLIGIVAALREEKNHELLLRAADRLRDTHPRAHWLIIGDGPERDNITRLREQLDLADRVHLLGTRHDTQRYLAALDLFTLCSLNEASPVSILEALACEVPVVATDVGSISETVIPGETGYLSRPEDLDDFTAQVDRLLADAAARTGFGREGRRRVIQTGSLDAMVRGYETLITEAFDRNVGDRGLVRWTTFRPAG